MYHFSTAKSVDELASTATTTAATQIISMWHQHAQYQLDRVDEMLPGKKQEEDGEQLVRHRLVKTKIF